MALLGANRLADAIALYREAVVVGNVKSQYVDEAGSADSSRSFLPAQLDLHRFPAELAKLAVLTELLDSSIRPPKEEGLVVVTGTGNHSPGGKAILQEVVLDWLKNDLGLDALEGDAARTPGRLWLPQKALNSLALTEDE
eukprot:TRINITY_DN21185_c0_g1_i1.p1 TRINITY_DN21185_c0_g1~~TRINITY_DN21185_c0_g1_i1.p1  ORF type:complete len:155 (+),score=37.26 TRINITY_DN21185_c0_g1_i1:48-467(+)